MTFFARAGALLPAWARAGRERGGIVLGTRARLRRNVAGQPFPGNASPRDRRRLAAVREADPDETARRLAQRALAVGGTHVLEGARGQHFRDPLRRRLEIGQHRLQRVGVVAIDGAVDEAVVDDDLHAHLRDEVAGPP